MHSHFKPCQVKVCCFRCFLFQFFYHRIKSLGFLFRPGCFLKDCVCCSMFTLLYWIVKRLIRRWTTKQNQCAGQSHWYPNKDSQYCFWLTSQVSLWIAIDFPCLAVSSPLSNAIGSLVNEFALCHFARQLSLFQPGTFVRIRGEKKGSEIDWR